MSPDGMFGLAIMLAIGLICFVFYFIPSFVAAGRGKKNGFAIFMLNLFLGWSLIGWVIALVWACTHDAGGKTND